MDRAALDFAMERGLAVGGWCPRGRRAEDGPIPDRYPLRETPSSAYQQRTLWNVRDSDATLILFQDRLCGGTLLTYRLVQRKKNGCRRTVDLNGRSDPELVWNWLQRHRVRVLNVAGPRECPDRRIYAQAKAFLCQVAAAAAAAESQLQLFS